MNKHICILLCFVFFLSGCSSYVESNDIGLVIGMGIDYEKESEKYEVTFQVVDPKGVASTPNGGQGLPIIQIKGQGQSLSEAARNSSKKFSRQNIYSHLAVIVISDVLAKEKGINFILDTFERDAKVRTNIPMVVSREKTAYEVLGNLSTADTIPAVSLVKRLSNTALVLGENVNITIYDTIAAISKKGQEPIINGMTIVGDIEQGSSKKNQETIKNTYVTLDGLAVFHNGYLVDWLEGHKSKSVPILLNEMKSTNITLPCLNKKGDISISVKAIKSKSIVTYNKREEKAKIKVNVTGAAYIDELLCSLDLDKPEVFSAIEKEVNKKIKKEIAEGIQFAQNLESDIFGFGEMLHRKNPKQWKIIENNWNEEFAAAEVDIKVRINIFGTGMRMKSHPF